MRALLFGIIATGLILIESSDVCAQYLRLRLGTEFPMQYWAGLNYQQGKRFSFDGSVGLVASPYNNELYDVITVPEEHQARKTFLQETTDDGWVLDGGANFHFGKWYAGIFAQRIQLNASATYSYILSSELVLKELNEDEKQTIDDYLNSPLALFVNFEDKITLQTVLFQMGLKIGRRFEFKNPRWDFRIELGFSKNMSSNSTSTYDASLIESILDLEEQLTGNRNNLGERLDFDARLQEVDDFFHDYGYIPTLNFGLSYQLFIPKKDRVTETPVVE